MDVFLNEVLNGTSYALFDGAMGTMLVREGLEAGELPELLCLEQPQLITGIHRAYVESGSQIVTTNTFGANSHKLAGSASVDEVFAAAVRCAREAGPLLVAADIGPTGDLIFPMGELGFSEAYELFASQARAAEAAGADLVIIETMADLVEMAAAVLAVKRNCGLPVMATMTFTATGRTFLGCAPKPAALFLQLLGVDALGVNCSAGPDDLRPVVFEMLEVSACPVIVQANAGLPTVVDGKTSYSLVPDDYVKAVGPMVDAGATIVGGCCGTDPDYVRGLSALLAGRSPQPRAIGPDEVNSLAREAAGEGGREAELIEMALDAADLDELMELLADEYDL